MSDDPASPNPEGEPSHPEEEKKAGDSWLDSEVGRRGATPMFHSDLTHHHKPTKRSHSRSRDKSVKNGTVWGIIAIIAIIAVGVGGYFLGVNDPFGMRPEPVPVPQEVSIFQAGPELQEKINKFYAEKAKGSYDQALTSLEAIAKEAPALPGIDYQLAETAFKLRDYNRSETYAESGLKKGDAPESCQMILALITWQKRKTMSVSMGDEPSFKAMELACSMDPFRPYPMYFLGEFKREAGEFDKGGELLSQAALRIDPLDSYIVVSIKAKLAQLQVQRDAIRNGTIPDIVKMDAENLEQRLIQALVYLYQDKPAEAAAALQLARHMLPKELFIVLINDPAFREFQLDPALNEFFTIKP